MGIEVELLKDEADFGAQFVDIRFPIGKVLTVNGQFPLVDRL